MNWCRDLTGHDMETEPADPDARFVVAPHFRPSIPQRKSFGSLGDQEPPRVGPFE